MTTRNPITHQGGASNPSQPFGIYTGVVTTRYSDVSAMVKVSALGITIGPCRAIDGLSLSKGTQVLCCYINGVMDEMVILGTLSGQWWHTHVLPVASAAHTHI